MCGINGIYLFNKKSAELERLMGMGRDMIHRGPDDDGAVARKHAAVGFQRLAIIDQAGASQPVFNEKNTIILVCNGEIYNYKTLRKQLIQRGHTFRTNGDVEVILHLYEEYGPACVDHFRGMFAFIIWDTEAELFFAARDHFGIKPFYYRTDESSLICSSELKSVINEAAVLPEIDEESLLHYLSFQYVPDPNTMVKGIKKLPPGHRLIAENNSMKTECYWMPEFTPMEKPWESVAANIRDALIDSVNAHRQSDFPVGSFLSSGIDSTAIASLLRRSGSLKTFSVGFEGALNECLISRETAKELDTEHHEWLLSETDFFDAVESSVWYQDDPVADPSAVPLYLLSQMASQHVKVVLSGEGADEFFGGYRIYQEPSALRYFNAVPQGMKSFAASTLKKLPHFYGKNYVRRGMTPLEKRYIGNAKIFTDDLPCIMRDSQSEKLEANAFQQVNQHYEKAFGLDDISKMQTIDTKLWLPGDILAKGDKMSMAHSLELRVPFVDRKVFEAARTISGSQKINRKTTKRVLRESMRGIVPDSVLNRQKLGFPVPLREWLKGSRGTECLSAIRNSGICSYINFDYANCLVKEHQAGKADHSRKIWCLYILARWHSLYIETDKTAFRGLSGVS